MFFRFERRESKQPEYRTLADVPEGVRCVVTRYTGDNTRQMVRVRSGDVSLTTDGISFAESPHCMGVHNILDPIPATPLPKTLAYVEEGRCVKIIGLDRMYFQRNGVAYAWDVTAGLVANYPAPLSRGVESLTDIYAVVCDVGP